MLQAVMEGEAVPLRYVSIMVAAVVGVSVFGWLSTTADAQLTDVTQTPNRANAGIHSGFQLNDER